MVTRDHTSTTSTTGGVRSPDSEEATLDRIEEHVDALSVLVADLKQLIDAKAGAEHQEVKG